jgi:antitoxin (DNA-binding transcriptional repressor) of toxin-antitoxin stability system
MIGMPIIRDGDAIEVDIAEVEANVSAYLQYVGTGKTLIIVKGKQPLARITPIASEELKPRPYGLCAGEFTVPDDFDARLPDEILQDFEL